jgi:hypothetical protein
VKGSGAGAAVLACGQAAEPPAEADLRGPRSLHDLGGETFVAAVEFSADSRRELIRPGGADEDVGDVARSGGEPTVARR